MLKGAKSNVITMKKETISFVVVLVDSDHYITFGRLPAYNVFVKCLPKLYDKCNSTIILPGLVYVIT